MAFISNTTNSSSISQKNFDKYTKIHHIIQQVQIHSKNSKKKNGKETYISQL